MSDFFQESLKRQQELIKSWMDVMPKVAPFTGTTVGLGDSSLLNDMYTNMVKSYQNMFGDWQKQFGSNPFFKGQPWTYNMFNTNETQVDVFNKIMNSTLVYNDLFKLYQSLIGKDAFASASEVKKFIEEKSSVYEKLTEDILTPFLPEGGKELFNNSKQLIKDYQELSNSFVAPWSDSAEDVAKDVQAAFKGDKNAYIDIYKRSFDCYEKTYGKFFNVSGFGATKEDTEQFLAGFDKFNKLYLAQVQLVALIEEVSKQNLIEVVQKFQEITKNGATPKTMKEFYDLFIKINEESFIKVFGTDEFSQLFGEYGKRAAEFKTESDLILEKLLAWAPVPKNSEMRNLYKTVYDLRKESYYNTKEIKTLKEEIAALKKIVAACNKKENGGK